MMTKNLLILWIVLFVACSPEKDDQELPLQDTQSADAGLNLSKVQMEAINLKVERYRPMTLDSCIKVTGYTHLPPQNIASISTFIAGYVKIIYRIDGEYVNRGQTLAILENPEYLDLQESYLITKNQLKYLEEDWERQKLLSDENLNARKSLNKSEAEYYTALAQYQSLKKKLEMLGFDIVSVEGGNFSSTIEIKTPISGYVSKSNITIGKYIVPSESLFEVINKNHMHLELSVYEHDAIKIRQGQKIVFSIPGYDHNRYEGEVFLVGQILEGDNRTITVHGHIWNEEKYKFMANMFVNASIIVDQKEGFALPENAVIRSGDKSYIFVADQKDASQSGFRKIEVSTGYTNEGWIHINPLETFNSDAQFVTEGAFYLARAYENVDSEGR